MLLLVVFRWDWSRVLSFKAFCIWISKLGFLTLTRLLKSFIRFWRKINLALTELYLKVIASLMTSSEDVSNSTEISSMYLYSRFWMKSSLPLPSLWSCRIAKYLEIVQWALRASSCFWWFFELFWVFRTKIDRIELLNWDFWEYWFWLLFCFFMMTYTWGSLWTLLNILMRRPINPSKSTFSCWVSLIWGKLSADTLKMNQKPKLMEKNEMKSALSCRLKSSRFNFLVSR